MLLCFDLRLNRRSGWLGLMCWLLPMLGWSQDTLTLGQVLRQAAAQNLDVRRQQNQQRIADVDRLERYAALLPTAEAEALGQRTAGLQFDNTTALLRNDVNDFAFAGVEVRWRLFGGLERYHDLQAARYAGQSAFHATERVRQAILFRVSEVFYQLLLDQELLRIARQNVQQQQTRLERIVGFVEAGVQPLTDRYLQEAEMRKAEGEMIAAENRLAQGQAELGRLLQLPPDPPVAVRAVPLPEDFRFELPATPAELYERALRQRPEIREQQTAQQAATAQMRAARGRYAPALDLLYSYNTRYSSFQPDQNFEEQFFRNNRRNQYAFLLTIPIFNGGRARADVQRARLVAENAAYDQQAVGRDLYAEVQAAWLDLRAIDARLRTAQARRRAAQLALAAQQERYDLGLANLVELAVVNLEWVTAQAEAAQAYYSLQLRQRGLELALGELRVDSATP